MLTATEFGLTYYLETFSLGYILLRYVGGTVLVNVSAVDDVV